MTTRASSVLLPAALAYAKRGWPVFPLTPRNKTPITSNGFKSATTERDRILAWWHLYPEANIGIATGVAFDVLDLDGEEGRITFLDYLVNHDAKGYVHDGPVGATGKGFHLLFAPTGHGNRAKLLEAPIDYRGLGGYIVAPPSIHPLGYQYRWLRNEKANPPEAPTWLTEMLGERLTHNTPQPVAIQRHRAPNGIETTILTTSGKIAESRPDIVVIANSLGLQVIAKTHYYVVSCPFHKEDTPSMALYPYPQDKFYCYGCGAHGDSHDLARKTDIEGRTFF